MTKWARTKTNKVGESQTIPLLFLVTLAKMLYLCRVNNEKRKERGMNTATIDSCKQALIQRISNAQSLHEIQDAYHSTMACYEEEEDCPCELPRYTMEEIHRMIDISRAEREAGMGIPHEEVMAEMEEFVNSL